ncbi:MAG: PA2779 family protein [Candidatus Omnitrophica bacterium]|nr:PA2779 family protein [Candidatus Omnitrophota bacterium]
MFQSLLKIKGVLRLMLVLAMLCGISPANSIAMPIDSQLVIQSSAGQNIYLEKVENFLNQDIVQKRLSKIGMSKEDAQIYVSQLDSVQLERLAKKVDTIESAGNTGVVILLVLVLIAMCVLYFADYSLKLEPRRNNNK